MPENKQYDRVKEITDQLEAGIAELFASEQYVTWLNTMSKFHDYSLNNTLLIAFQKPDATLVAGYTAWQKQFGRQVQRGEKAIRILAPTPYKQKVEMEKIDPVTQKPVLDENGNPVREETEVKRMGFKVASVFDVSQTQGRELPTLGVDELSGEVKDYDLFFEALKKTCPVPMEFEDIEGGAKGYYHQIEQRIAIQKDMSQIQTIKTAIHEMTHQKLHTIDPDKKISDMPKLTRNGKEVEAESVAYTVCQHFGIDTSDYSFAYVAGWSHGKETPELKASLMTIRKAASELIDEIEGHVKELVKERDSEITIEDKAMALAGKLDAFSYDYDYYGYMDAVDDREAAVLSTRDQLLSGGKDAEGILEYLQGIVDEDDEYKDQAKKLISEVKALGMSIPQKTKELTDYDLIHSNPSFSTEQVEYLTELSKQGFNIQAFWVNGQPVDLTTGPLSAEDISRIRYQVEVDAIPKTLFDNEQWRQIQSGIQQELDVRIYAKPEFSAQQMDMVKRALITESHGYITMDDVSRIADPSHSADEMKRMLRDVRKESMQRISAEKEAADAQAGLQDNGHYRYYSTQRPVRPGSFPKDGVELIGFENFDQRQPVDDGKILAWGYVEYKEPLTKKQQTDYELRPAESHMPKTIGQNRTEAAKEAARTAESRVEARAVVPKSEAGRKRSVLADLHEKQALIAGTKVSGRTQNQMKEEPR